MKQNQVQIVATIGPSTFGDDVINRLVESGLGAARLNFSWGTKEERVEQIRLIRSVAAEHGRIIPIIADLPGPRVQRDGSHTYDPAKVSSITDNDRALLRFAVEQGLEYVAVSFVGGPEDIQECRGIVEGLGGSQRIIAKIERAVALERLDDIIAVSDAVMVARGDLGEEVALEKIPFVQETIIKSAKSAGKPVITATQMMLSMVSSPVPTRAEVTDVYVAVLQGSDAVMLSEETARGAYPIETVSMMYRIVAEAEGHRSDGLKVNSL